MPRPLTGGVGALPSSSPSDVGVSAVDSGCGAAGSGSAGVASAGGVDFFAPGRLAPAAIAYVAVLREARDQSRRLQWVIWSCAAAVLALAVFDTYTATPRVAAVSWLFVAFFAFEIFLWPRVQDRLLANADRTEQSARRLTG